MSLTARFSLFGAMPAAPSRTPRPGQLPRFGVKEPADTFSSSAEPSAHELEILPIEARISDAIVEAVNAFAREYPHREPAYQPARYQFVDAVHLCQDALGATRFWGSMNAQARRRRNATDPPMTTPAKLQKLIRWGKDFRAQAMARQTTDIGKFVMTKLCDAWDEYMELTRQFPHQHNYDDFQRGMKQIERLLVKLGKIEKIPAR